MRKKTGGKRKVCNEEKKRGKKESMYTSRSLLLSPSTEAEMRKKEEIKEQECISYAGCYWVRARKPKLEKKGGKRERMYTSRRLLFSPSTDAKMRKESPPSSLYEEGEKGGKEKVCIPHAGCYLARARRPKWEMSLPPAHCMTELTREFRDLFWVFEQRCAASVSIRTCSVSAPEVHTGFSLGLDSISFEQRCSASVSIRTCSVSVPEVHVSMKHIAIRSLINSSVNSLIFPISWLIIMNYL